MTAAARFAAHAVSTRFADLPAAAVGAPRSCARQPRRRHCRLLGRGRRGIAARRRRLGRARRRRLGPHGAPSAPAAAFLNAWQMHNQEYDCLHEGAVVHAMATVLPAALAAAELRGGASGAELIAAIAVGVDIAAGLGLASRAGFRFFRPATAGGFGAVAAAGRLLGLDRAALEAAFAWQLAQVSGTMQAHTEGSPILPVQLAFNARAALQSCELARLGFAPARAVFEGPYGYLAVFEGAFALEPVLDEPRPRLAHRGVQPQAVSRGPRHPWRHRRRHGAAGRAWLHRRGCRAGRDHRAAPDRAPGRPAATGPTRARAMPACAWPTRWPRCCRTVRSTWRISAATRWPIPRRMRWQHASRPAATARRSQRAGAAEPGRASANGTDARLALRDDARQPGASPDAEPASRQVQPVPGFCRRGARP